MTTTRIDPSNRAQADAWDGEDGEYWAIHAERFEAVLSAYQPAFEQACRISSTDVVLDVGCGTGGTTLSAARAADQGTAVGVDLSARMLSVARAAAARQELRNVRFEQADAQVAPFAAAGFDTVISRTGAMFFGDPERAFGNLGRALRPGGRLTLLTWQAAERNPWFDAFARALLGTVPGPAPDSPGPFSLGDPDHVVRLLGRAGFQQVTVTGLTGPLTYGRTVDDAHGFLIGLLGWMLERRPPQDRPAATQALRDALAQHVGVDGVQFDSATWLITARRP